VELGGRIYFESFRFKLFELALRARYGKNGMMLFCQEQCCLVPDSAAGACDDNIHTPLK
jgi:hypothetical protein